MNESARARVEIYTDGGCEPNPGRGGFGVVLLQGKKRLEVSAGFRATTNNRMELLAAIVGLEVLNEACEVTIFSDSNYLVKAMKLGWARNWKRKGWRRGTEGVPNADLWERLLAMGEMHRVRFEWVRGHAGNVENERCDVLSGAALRAGKLLVDVGYESKGAEKAAELL